MLDVALSDAFKDTIMVLSLLALLVQEYFALSDAFMDTIMVLSVLALLVQKYVRSNMLDVALSDAFKDTILVQKYKYYWYKSTEKFKHRRVRGAE